MKIDIMISGAAPIYLDISWEEVCEIRGQAYKALEWLDSLLYELKHPSSSAIRVNLPERPHAMMIHANKIYSYDVNLDDVPYIESEFSDSIRSSLT